MKIVLRELTSTLVAFSEVRELINNVALFYAPTTCVWRWLWRKLHMTPCSMSWMTNNRKLFYITEKAHYVQYIAIDLLQQRFNPRYGWTYQDEDYMGRMAQVAKACMRARGPLRFAVSFIFRWRTVMFIRWSRRARARPA